MPCANWQLSRTTPLPTSHIYFKRNLFWIKKTSRPLKTGAVQVPSWFAAGQQQKAACPSAPAARALIRFKLWKLLPAQLFGSIHNTHHTPAVQNHDPIICTQPKPESLPFISFSFKLEKKKIELWTFFPFLQKNNAFFKGCSWVTWGNKRNTQTWVERTWFN